MVQNKPLVPHDRNFMKYSKALAFTTRNRIPPSTYALIEIEAVVQELLGLCIGLCG